MESHTATRGDLKQQLPSQNNLFSTDLALAELIQRAQWLRAAMLGANDGLLSTTAIMLGIGAAREDRWSMIFSGLAGAVAGACSMAVGEFVSVATQRDIEEMGVRKSSQNQQAIQPNHLMSSPRITQNTEEDVENELPKNLTHLSRLSSVSPGKSPVISTPGRSPTMRVILEDNARVVAVTGGDDDEERTLPNPVTAAVASAMAFACGSSVPLVSAIVITESKIRIYVLVLVASVALLVFGGAGAYLGGSRVKVSSLRVLVGGWISMGITYGLLKAFDDDKILKN